MTSEVSTRAARLAVQRLPLAGWQAAAAAPDAGLLGALAYGGGVGQDDGNGNGNGSCDGEGDPGARLTLVALPALLAGEPRIDVWRGTGSVQAGRTGQVRWWRDDAWLFGTLDLDEARHGAGGFAELSRQAYRDVFETMAQSRRPHLLRLWNYVPRINSADEDGLERYRQFNAGRQQAFLEAGRAVLEGAPAACALGTPSGPLAIRFLAGRAAPVPVENPRQVSAYRYPSDYGPRAPTFSRAALADLGGGRLALLISGTASIVGHATVHAGDVRAQTAEALRNLQAVIDSAHARCSARFDLARLDGVVYVRHAGDAAAVHEVLARSWGAASHSLRNAIFLQADICRADLLVEIEAHAVAPGALLHP